MREWHFRCSAFRDLTIEGNIEAPSAIKAFEGVIAMLKERVPTVPDFNRVEITEIKTKQT